MQHDFSGLIQFTLPISVVFWDKLVFTKTRSTLKKKRTICYHKSRKLMNKYKKNNITNIKYIIVEISHIST